MNHKVTVPPIIGLTVAKMFSLLSKCFIPIHFSTPVKLCHNASAISLLKVFLLTATQTYLY